MVQISTKHLLRATQTIRAARRSLSFPCGQRLSVLCWRWLMNWWDASAKEQEIQWQRRRGPPLVTCNSPGWRCAPQHWADRCRGFFWSSIFRSASVKGPVALITHLALTSNSCPMKENSINHQGLFICGLWQAGLLIYQRTPPSLCNRVARVCPWETSQDCN